MFRESNLIFAMATFTALVLTITSANQTSADIVKLHLKQQRRRELRRSKVVGAVLSLVRVGGDRHMPHGRPQFRRIQRIENVVDTGHDHVFAVRFPHSIASKCDLFVHH